MLWLPVSLREEQCSVKISRNTYEFCIQEGAVVSISARAAEHGSVVDYGWISRLCMRVAVEGVP